MRVREVLQGVRHCAMRMRCECYGRNTDNVLRDLTHAGAWGQCVTVRSDNKQKTSLCNNCA